MRILLCEDIRGLGWLGDVVDVNAGYARNYLLPQGLGKPATDTNLRSIAKEKASRAEERKLEAEKLKVVAEAVEGAEAVVAAKANEQGVLFGSVSASEIAQNLREQGFEIADEFVDPHEHIKNVGTAQVKLTFTEDLTATVSVVVVPEGGSVEAIKAAEKEAAEKAAEEKAAAEKAAAEKAAAEEAPEQKEPEKKDKAKKGKGKKEES
ncbi:MAG: 50S ribosomal protein L9 [Planctomycetota bacterium]|jgi:large subunit ribosomal protein L9